MSVVDGVEALAHEDAVHPTLGVRLEDERQEGDVFVGYDSEIVRNEGTADDDIGVEKKLPNLGQCLGLREQASVDYAVACPLCYGTADERRCTEPGLGSVCLNVECDESF